MAIHVHPRDPEGHETLEGGHIGEALLAAAREAVSVPIGVNTGAWFLQDPADRLRAIESWEILPDFVSVNFHESGAIDVARPLRHIDDDYDPTTTGAGTAAAEFYRSVAPWTQR